MPPEAGLWETSQTRNVPGGQVLAFHVLHHYHRAVQAQGWRWRFERALRRWRP